MNSESSTSTSSSASSFPVSRTSTPNDSNGSNNNIPYEQRQTKICVYCGASPGTKPEHMEMARSLAKVMAENNIGLVYGGGTVGIMGELARTLVSLSGPTSVHGIIPEALVKYERDALYSSSATAPSPSSSTPNDPSTTTTQTSIPAPVVSLPVPSEALYGKTTIVRDMHMRKQIMAREVIDGGPGSGFIALSGGYGTLEELLETSTWNQLGIHDRGICVLNVNGFFDGLLAWIDKAVGEGFVREGNEKIIARAESAEGAVKALRGYVVADTVFKLQWGTQ